MRDRPKEFPLVQNPRLDRFISRCQFSTHYLRGVDDDYVGRARVRVDVQERAELYVHLRFFPCLSNRGFLNAFTTVYITAREYPFPHSRLYASLHQDYSSIKS